MAAKNAKKSRAKPKRTTKPRKRTNKPIKRARKQARPAKAKPGTDFEKGIDDFAEEMEWHGKRLEKHGKRLETKAKSWWYTTFGPVGPLIQSFIGIAVIGVVTILISILNLALASVFLVGLTSFMMDYIMVFLAIFLFFNYIKYVYYTIPKSRDILRPLETASGLSVIIWVFGWVLLLAHQSAEIGIFQRLANWIFPNLWTFFIIILVIAYLGAIMVHSQKRIANEGGKR